MIQTYSHTFKFKIDDINQKGRMSDNIISIVAEDSQKYYVQYMQYIVEKDENDNDIFSYRQINIKVDRFYFLEIANITIDERERRRKIFSVLGKRRFGANNNLVDYYFIDKSLNIGSVVDCLNKCKEKKKIKSVYFEKLSESKNSYKAYTFECGDNYFAVLNQNNATSRRVFEKNFIVELRDSDVIKFKSRHNSETKIEFLFNKIGKNYFKSLEKKNISINNEQIDAEDAINEMTLNYRQNDDSNLSGDLPESFDILKSRQKAIEPAYFDLYGKSIELINNPSDENTVFLFSGAIINFVKLFKDVNVFNDISSLLTTIHLLVEDGKFGELLKKQDKDFRDIFIYMLECLGDWNHSLTDSSRYYVSATIDLHNSLKHLIDTYFLFNHNYKSRVVNEDKKEVEVVSTTSVHVISAKEFFEDNKLDDDSVDELYELDQEVQHILFSHTLDEEFYEDIIGFFHGYVRVLNTLFEFQDLGYSLNLICTQLEKLDRKENNKSLLIVLQAIVTDLQDWKKSVLIEQSADDIHYMDKSFYTNIGLIENTLNGLGEQLDTGSVEFF